MCVSLEDDQEVSASLEKKDLQVVFSYDKCLLYFTIVIYRSTH